MASGVDDYPIYLIDEDNLLVAKLDDTDGRASCLIKLANIVRAVMKTDEFRSALVQMATEFCELNPTAWFLQQGQGTREQKIKNVVQDFLDMFLVRRGFPTLCCSDRLMYQDVTGVSHRYEPQGPFILSTERIVLNGMRLQMILDLHMKELNACRIIQFQFVVTILHETGHIFFTFLSKGAIDTPNLPDKPGESGFRLEELVFGGRLVFLRDKRVGDSDYGAGSVLMKKQDGAEKSKWFLVTKEAIDSILDMDFQLPFKKGCIIQQKVKDLRGHFTKMEEREEGEGESEDPGLHPEWYKKLKDIDPEGYENLKKAFPEGYKKRETSENKNGYFCNVAGSKQQLLEFS